MMKLAQQPKTPPRQPQPKGVPEVAIFAGADDRPDDPMEVVSVTELPKDPREPLEVYTPVTMRAKATKFLAALEELDVLVALLEDMLKECKIGVLNGDGTDLTNAEWAIHETFKDRNQELASKVFELFQDHQKLRQLHKPQKSRAPKESDVPYHL